MMRSWCVVILSCVFAITGMAETLNVPANYGTIQAAINAASHGDVVLVAPGTYVENIDYLGKSIIVLSSGGPEITVIDGNKAGSVVTFQNGEGTGSVIDGFTITNGSSPTFGGGVNCHESSPSIVNNLIYKNDAEHGGGISGYITSFRVANNMISLNSCTSHHGQGGGIYCSGTSSTVTHPTIENNTISYNISSSEAGGIMCNSAFATISNNHISNNHASNDGGGIKFVYYGKDISPSPGIVRMSLIEGNKISNNVARSGGGLHCEGDGGDLRVISNKVYGNNADFGGGIVCTVGATTRLYNNVVYGNSATGTIVGGGGGIFCNSEAVFVNITLANNTASIRGGGFFCEIASPEITNSILWNNSAPADFEIYGSPNVNYSDIKGGWATGTGNLSANPFFTTGPDGDHYLGLVSPCIDSGSVPSMNLSLHTCSTRTDGGLDDGMVDMGFHYGAFSYPSLTTDVYQVSEVGGKVHFALAAGSVNGNRSYLLVAGATGIEPGFTLPGGVNLPVNFDVFTYDVLFPLLNTIVFQNFMGILSPQGHGEATLNTGTLPPGYVGMRMFYAYCLAFPWEFASNPIEIDIVP